MKKQYNLNCNIAQTLNIIGDRWSLLILHELLLGRTTFKEIQSGLESIPTNLLSERLKRLESDGLIVSSLYQSHPPRYAYKLTESGEDLKGVFNSFILWGSKHLDPAYKKLIHNECGHTVEIQYFCSHCGKTVHEDECSSCEFIVNSDDE
ncbi:winged helix-turn-helix transcriptional regulator [Bacillus massiliigorillae]|uniref:winged helix-turn-helix transcriptional regulator n=1 Tax=Bacillus massiliigorillae TaxID=1243664 RepID=UPI0003A88A30|nr:helix-turn-helix domain-containing protein [Bacillus massiliigorillae]